MTDSGQLDLAEQHVFVCGLILIIWDSAHDRFRSAFDLAEQRAFVCGLILTTEDSAHDRFRSVFDLAE